MHNNSHLSESEYLNWYSYTWGEDEVETLLSKGFVPTRTDHGWRWILPLTQGEMSATMNPRSRVSPVSRG